MLQHYGNLELHDNVLAVMRETGVNDPFEAVRTKARSVVEQYHRAFGEEPPFNMQAVASLRGLRWSDDDPRFSPDSEIAPEIDGGVVLRVNKSRPFSRQRFSIGHEIGHTLFPDYQVSVRCRKANDRAWADPNDLLETLCDVAAVEFLFPQPWFSERVAAVPPSAAAIANLAREFQASREATTRRYVELSARPCAVVFLSWKLKPKQHSQLKRDRHQTFLFGEDPVADADSKRKLRVDYAIANEAFERRCGTHIPKDKSVESHGTIYEAASQQRCVDGHSYLDLGPIHGTFMVHSIPIYTLAHDVGPKGESSIAAVICPQ